MSDLTSKSVEGIRREMMRVLSLPLQSSDTAQTVINIFYELARRLEEAQRERDEANEAHDAEVAAKALEEASMRFGRHSTCGRALRMAAAEYRAKAGRKE